MELMSGGLAKTTGEIGLDLVWFCVADACGLGEGDYSPTSPNVERLL
jgi:hypothetical protein